MKTNKHALVLFTKYPEPGITKTRLMEENGGNLTAVEAAELYRAMALDTANVGIHALQECRQANGKADEFDFFVSSSPEEHMPKIREMFNGSLPTETIGYVLDTGRNFDEHFDSCYQQLFGQGYQSVICIGGDLPGITTGLICRAFSQLINLDKLSANGAMVLAPCQAAGVSLVGITKDTPVDFKGVFYNEEGVTTLDALVLLAAKEDIPMAVFEALSDVDYGEDLGHMVSVINAMEYASGFQKDILVPKRTLAWVRKTGIIANAPPNKSIDSREKIDD